jgi:hypothetical protein
LFLVGEVNAEFSMVWLLTAFISLFVRRSLTERIDHFERLANALRELVLPPRRKK